MSTEDHRSDPHRLPGRVRPSRYDVELVVDPDRPDFSGTTLIEVVVSEPVRIVVLNSLDLDILTATITTEVGDVLHPSTTVDAEHERLVLHLDRELPAGTASIELAFSGAFCDSLVGLYRSALTLGDVERHVAVTQFESTHARQAFPCFDEPSMKATFGIRLVVPEDLLAVSNAAEVKREPLGDGTVRVTFADTIVMSPYLVAFVVGPLVATPERQVPGTAGAIPLRVVCPPGSERLGDFALEVADAGIRFFEEYYDLPYPGDKIDLVAVPDFAFGAMENLGCIIFREVALLVDPDEATQPELQRVADVVNHELAHMWFGNLVTMRWWDGIWLNEAFATFMEVTASDAFRPDWDTWTTFGLARTGAFDTDALASTRPIEFPVTSPAESEAMFDVLTYEKGASVVRMLEQYLGAETFRDGVRDYLATHAYSNTEAYDLWSAMERASGEPVGRFMDAWIHDGGHPVVTAELTDTGVELSQRPAGPYADGRSGGPPEWSIPMVLTSTVDGVERRDAVLLDRTRTLDLGGTPSALRLNTAGFGFFRSAVPPALRAAELTRADSTPLERFVVIDDVVAALIRGDVGADEVESVLRLGSRLETDPSVWRRIALAARDLQRLRGVEASEVTARLAVDIATEPLARAQEAIAVDGGGESTRWQDVRGTLVGLLGIIGAQSRIRSMAFELFHEDDGTGHEDAALLAAALRVVAATGGAEDHALIEHRWRSATNPQDTIRHLHALADTPVQDCFDHVLDMTLDDVRAQDRAFVLRRALNHREFAGRAWAFVSGNWEDVASKVPASALVRMLEGVRLVTDRDLALAIEDFTTSHPLPSGERVLAQHIERMWTMVRTAERLG